MTTEVADHATEVANLAREAADQATEVANLAREAADGAKEMTTCQFTPSHLPTSPSTSSSVPYTHLTPPTKTLVHTPALATSTTHNRTSLMSYEPHQHKQ